MLAFRPEPRAACGHGCPAFCNDLRGGLGIVVPLGLGQALRGRPVCRQRCLVFLSLIAHESLTGAVSQAAALTPPAAPHAGQ